MASLANVTRTWPSVLLAIWGTAACSSVTVTGTTTTAASSSSTGVPTSSGSSGAATSTGGTTASSGSGTGSSTAGSPIASQCDILGSMYDAGAIDPSAPCQVCNPSIDAGTWTPAENGAQCQGTTQFGYCLDGVCQLDQCLLSGVATNQGSVDPSNVCQVCNPQQSSNTWSPGPDGTPCVGPDGGQICIAGQCVPGCYFDGAPCSGPDGGNVCVSRQCVSGCYFDGGVSARDNQSGGFLPPAVLIPIGSPASWDSCSTCQVAPDAGPSLVPTAAVGAPCETYGDAGICVVGDIVSLTQVACCTPDGLTDAGTCCPPQWKAAGSCCGPHQQC